MELAFSWTSPVTLPRLSAISRWQRVTRPAVLRDDPFQQTQVLRAAPLLEKAMAKLGVTVLVIAPIGGVLGAGAKATIVKRTAATARSIEFDALLVPGGTSVTGDIKQTILLHKVFRQCKAIGAPSAHKPDGYRPGPAPTPQWPAPGPGSAPPTYADATQRAPPRPPASLTGSAGSPATPAGTSTGFAEHGCQPATGQPATVSPPPGS